MDHKNIDRLFQEKLKNLEASPNKRVWSAIESKLDKKKRRVLPFWWFSGGIAALFILGLLLFPFSEKQHNINNNPIIVTEKQIEESDDSNKTILDSVANKSIQKETILIADEKNNKKKTIKKNKQVNKQPFFMAGNNVIKEKLVKEKSKQKNFKIDSNAIKNEKIITSKKQDPVSKKSNASEGLKPKKDFLTVVKKEKDKETEAIKETDNAWSVSPVVAILNSNSFSDTSPIDNNLLNSTSGKNSFSYGVQVSYKINKKWSIQSGIHQQKMRYENNNISVSNTSTSSRSSAVFSTGNSFNFDGNRNVESFSVSNVSLTNTVSSNGELLQEYGYIEIPLEIKYNVSNNQKFNTQLVAGFSSLFLNRNNLELNTNTVNQFGNADNLNAINFSGNFGVDFNYFLDKKWSIHINPMFKAQLNTFSENSNGFSPFNIGVYSGVKYNF
ncbi:hypothetical protein [uncultured Polaribacter sp.]|uniref:hypothetical protein n=1 Tax=uncultured Polaribacter sp. TaxID=174711 RepID=UPI002617BE3B|nr:hypothetical protein [uncultured Polaribacter sp.]